MRYREYSWPTLRGIGINVTVAGLGVTDVLVTVAGLGVVVFVTVALELATVLADVASVVLAVPLEVLFATVVFGAVFGGSFRNKVSVAILVLKDPGENETNKYMHCTQLLYNIIVNCCTWRGTTESLDHERHHSLLAHHQIKCKAHINGFEFALHIHTSFQ